VDYVYDGDSLIAEKKGTSGYIYTYNPDETIASRKYCSQFSGNTCSVYSSSEGETNYNEYLYDDGHNVVWNIGGCKNIDTSNGTCLDATRRAYQIINDDSGNQIAKILCREFDMGTRTCTTSGNTIGV
jgi:hypothetical protein